MSYAQEQYKETELLLQQALSISRKQLGNSHPQTASILNNLAGLYSFQGDLSQAITYWQQGAESEEATLKAILAMGSERRKRAYLATVSDTTDNTLSFHLQDAPNNSDTTL